MLFPIVGDELIGSPEKFTVELPEKAEMQYYCSKCNRIVYIKDDNTCPICQNKIIPYSIMS